MTFISALNLDKIDLVSTNTQIGEYNILNTKINNLSNVVSTNDNEIQDLDIRVSQIEGNYVDLTSSQVIVRKSFDFFANNFTNFPTSGGGGGGGGGGDVGLSNYQTLTNKTMDFKSNTFLNFETFDASILNIGISNNSSNIKSVDTSLSNYKIVNDALLADNISQTSINSNNILINSNNLNIANARIDTNILNNIAVDTKYTILSNNYDTRLNTNSNNILTNINNLSTLSNNFDTRLNTNSNNILINGTNLISLSNSLINYSTLSTPQTLTNKTFVFSSNNFIGFSSGTGGGSNYYLNDEPIGSVIDYGGTSAPTNWFFCFGQAVSRTTYSDLFSAIGTTFGVGNGSTTFNVPDYRGRVSAGKDDMGGSSANRLTGSNLGVNGSNLGASGGEESHKLTIAEMPSHNHTSTLTSALAYTLAYTATLTSGSGYANLVNTISYTGGSSNHNIVQPTIIMNKIIKYAVSGNLVSYSSTSNIFNYNYTGTGNIMTGQTNSNNYIPYWSSNNSTFLTNGISLSNLNCAGLYAGSNIINVSTATAPTSNQVLTAISASNAIWSTPSGSSINIYKFRTTLSAVQSIPVSTLTTIALSTITFDTNNNFNTTTFAYTVPITGFYQTNAMLRWGVLGINGGRYILQVYANSTLALDSDFFGSGAVNQNVIAEIYNFTIGDILTLKVFYTPPSGTVSQNIQPLGTSFSMFLIST